MIKFNRKFKLSVQERSDLLLLPNPTFRVIEPPFTLKLDIQQNTLSSSNNASVQVYNLSPEVRANLRHDENDYGAVQRLVLDAGYGDNLSNVFDGNIFQAWSVREETNFVTHFECFDMGQAFMTGTMNETFAAGTPTQNIINQAIRSMPGLSVGKIGQGFNGTIPRGNSYSGNPVDILTQMTGGNFSVVNGKVYCLSDNEAINGQLQVIDNSTGILNTPVRQLYYVNVEMIFEPRLKMFQKVLLNSSTDPSFNGEYKVISLQHRAIISEAVSGEAVTRVGLQPGSFNVI